jgi:hypothetical protein
MINVQEIVKNAKADISLISNIDVDELLSAIENTKNEHLDNKVLLDISREIIDELHELSWLPSTNTKTKKENILGLYNKLTEYRLISEIYQIHRGKHVRWIRRSNPKNTLTNGGIVMDVKFLDGGTNVIVKTNSAKIPIIQFKYDECITFQKMSQDELLILTAYELIRNNEEYHCKK